MGGSRVIMSHIALFVKADVDGIEAFAPCEDHVWCIDVKNSQGEEFRTEVMVDPTNEEDLEGSKGTCNFQLKWEGSRKASYMNFVSNKNVKAEYTAWVFARITQCLQAVDSDDSGCWVPIVAWECRGLEPVKWHPQGNFTARGTTGTSFDDVDLSNPDGWDDYDDDAQVPTMIMELEWKFDAIAKK